MKGGHKGNTYDETEGKKWEKKLGKPKKSWQKGAHSLADVFWREVDNLLVHGPFLVTLHDSFLKANTNCCITTFQRESCHNELHQRRGESIHIQTLKYMGAISPSSRGSGIHSRTMCRLLRGFMCVSMNTQSRSWDSNIRTRVRRNSWGQQSSTEVNKFKWIHVWSNQWKWKQHWVMIISTF